MLRTGFSTRFIIAGEMERRALITCGESGSEGLAASRQPQRQIGLQTFRTGEIGGLPDPPERLQDVLILIDARRLTENNSLDILPFRSSLMIRSSSSGVIGNMLYESTISSHLPLGNI